MLIFISCIIAKQSAKLGSHFASLKMHHTHAYRKFHKMGSNAHIAICYRTSWCNLWSRIASHALSCNHSLWTIPLAGSNKNRHSFKNLAEDGTLNGKGASLCNSVPNIENGRMVCKNYGNGGKKCSPICNDGHQFYQKVAEQFIPRLFNPKQQTLTFQTSSLLPWTFQPKKS